MTKAYETTVITETVDYELDAAKLTEPVAAAIRDAIAEGIRGITETGRDGHRLFNRTGALVTGLHVERDGDAFAVVPPADHFQGANADVMLARLVDLVPVIADPSSAPRVATALEKSAGDMAKPGPTTRETF